MLYKNRKTYHLILAAAALFYITITVLLVTRATSGGYLAADAVGQLTVGTNFEESFEQAGKNNSPDSLGTINDLGFALTTYGAGAGVAIDTVRHYLFASDSDNNRVLVFQLDNNNNKTLTDPHAAYVFGASDFTSQGSGGAINIPEALVFDPVTNYLYVANYGGGTVSIFDTADLSTKINSQTYDNPAPLYRTQAYGNSYGMALDTNNYLLYVSDSGNHVINVFDVRTDGGNPSSARTLCGVSTTGLSSGVTIAPITCVLNDPNDVDRQGVAPHKFDTPESLSLDLTPSHERLYIADNGNNRVVMYDVRPNFNPDPILNPLPDETLCNTVTQGLASMMDASCVIGQPDLDSRFLNWNGVDPQDQVGQSATGLQGPNGVSFDSATSSLYVFDASNHRVLTFNVTDMSGATNDYKTATSVIGQPDFTTGATNPTNQASFLTFGEIVFEASTKYLYLLDGQNNRLMMFDMDSGSPDYVFKDANKYAVHEVGQYITTNPIHIPVVWSQPDINTKSGYVNNAGFDLGAGSASSGVAIDTVHHRLFISDTNNNRVLVFYLDPTTNTITDSGTYDHFADNVLGQINFEDTTANRGAPVGADALSGPQGLAYDSMTDRLFVSDAGNNRILVYSTATITDGMAASYVVGQADTSSSDPDTSVTGLSGPSGLFFDEDGNILYVADTDNNRVLGFSGTIAANGESATYVFGQADYNGSTATTSISGLSAPRGITTDTDHVYIADTANNRVMIFDKTLIDDNTLGAKGDHGVAMSAANELGQPNASAFTNDAATTSQAGLSGPIGLAVSGRTLYVADTVNNRVSVFSTTAFVNGQDAHAILGQLDFDSSDPNMGLTDPDQDTLAIPTQMAVDPDNNRLYVVDRSNNRVMMYDFVYLEPFTCDPGIQGTPYSKTLVAQNTAQGTTTFEVVSGILPDGLTLDPDTGEISGIPSTAGDFLDIVIRAVTTFDTGSEVFYFYY